MSKKTKNINLLPEHIEYLDTFENASEKIRHLLDSDPDYVKFKQERGYSDTPKRKEKNEKND